MAASEILESYYNDRTRGAVEWKSAGGQVIGYTGPPCPVELISAAGLLPVRVSGHPDTGHAAFDKYALPTHPKWSTGARQIALEYVNAITENVLNGTWNVLDHLVVTNPRKAVFLIHSILCHSKQMDPELVAPESHFLDHAIVSSYDGSRFHKRVFDLFRAELETWSGNSITTAALEKSIAEANQTRALLAKLQALRSEASPRLSGESALIAAGAVQTMPAAQANDLLAALIEETEAASPREGARVFVAGSMLDNVSLYRAIEAAGATVVGESHNFGTAALGPQIRTDIDPFAAAADHFHRQRPDAVYPMMDAIADTVGKAQAVSPDLVVLHVYYADDHLAWQAPTEIEAMKSAGLPTIYLAEAPYRMADPAAVTNKIADALASADALLETVR